MIQQKTKKTKWKKIQPAIEINPQIWNPTNFQSESPMESQTYVPMSNSDIWVENLLYNRVLSLVANFPSSIANVTFRVSLL